MKSVPKLIKRFVGILMLSSLLILVINFAVLAIITATQAPNGSPWTTAEQAAESMEKSEQGYKMSDEMIEELNAQNVWAVYIDNATGECVWHGAIVVSDIICGSFSPNPLERWMVYFAEPIRLRISAFSRSS